MSDSQILVAKDIRKSFQIGDREVGVLHGAHLSLNRGERLCMMGASGAGKSTLLDLLAGRAPRKKQARWSSSGRARTKWIT